MKQGMTAMFIVAADGSFVSEPFVIWRSKVPRCFRSFKDQSVLLWKSLKSASESVVLMLKITMK